MFKKIIRNKLIYILVGLIIFSLFGYWGFLSDLFIFNSVRRGTYGFISPISISFVILAIDSIVLSFLAKTKRSGISGCFGSVKICAILRYFIIFSSGIITIFIIRDLYIFLGLDFKVDALFEIGFKEIFWFLVFINIFIGYLLFSLLNYRHISDLALSFRDKMIIVFSILLVLVIVSIVFSLILFLIPLMLSFLIFIFVLDIYMDKKVLNSTWIFTFMILISGFTALILFTGYSDIRRETRVEKIKKSMFYPDKEIEKFILSDELEIVNTDSFYIVQDTVGKSYFLEQINDGFYNISKSLYFNPRLGDYIYLLRKYSPNTNYIIRHLYNRKPYLDIKSIIFVGDRVLSNNTLYKTIAITDDVSKDNTKLKEYFVDGLSYLKYKIDDDITVINIENVPGILIPFSLFSMLFVLTGIFLFFISVINSRFHFLPEIVRISFDGIVSLRDKIQVSIIGLVVASFFILGTITFYYIINFSENNQRKAAIEFTNNSFDKEKLRSLSNIDILDELLELNRANKAKFYLYDSVGNLVQDKRNKINSDKTIPWKRMDKDVFIMAKTDHYLLKEDRILLSMFPLLNNRNSFLVGYFIDRNSLIEASEILSNFLNVYVLLFLIAGAIAIALANSISRPIDILGEKLEILNLSENNELLKWDTQDEIGKLISIYNNTVRKLEESAKIITKIGRDSAWREMAKQVAHEIKNPLTPLKLNIQYMQSVVLHTPERAADMVMQLAPGLIEQINNLDKIASEFADFAKMPSASNEKVKLNEIVKAVHDFFRKREDLDIQLYVPINDLIVFADKNHLVSIFNNILKNAIQAIPTEEEGKIVIELYKKNNDAIVKITDNGVGIPEAMISKVFSPNFTTKNSGTGLGLAISTNMVMAFNGKIYFETKVGEGTSFFVEIPLMRIQDNYPGQKRVLLDD